MEFSGVLVVKDELYTFTFNQAARTKKTPASFQKRGPAIESGGDLLYGPIDAFANDLRCPAVNLTIKAILSNRPFVF
jgi:hypothetical protein